jgi:hypothetical protein
MTWFYSASIEGFLDSADKENFGDSWPGDAIEISDELHASLLCGQSLGKVIVAGEDGAPALTDRVVDYVAIAEIEKSQRLASATAAMAPLQDAVDLGIATDEETALLTAWKKYRVLLNRVDISKAPDIEWPEKP